MTMQEGMLYLLNGPFGGGMMRGGPGFGLFWALLVNVFWTALIVLAVLWLVRNWGGIKSTLQRATTPAGSGATPATPVQTPLEIVQMRYARGEITRDEYETLRRDLSGEAPAAPA
jgi:putative membrane protein